jgi:hypothetical protein
MFADLFRRESTGSGPLMALPARRLETFPPTGIALRIARAGSSDLRRASRKFGVSLTTLLLGAVSVAISRIAKIPRGRFRGRISIDLRSLYREAPKVGNFVVSSIADVDADGDVPALLARLESSPRRALGRLRGRRAGLSFFFEALTQSLGRKFNGKMFSLARRKQWLYKTRVHVTNLGGLELLDERGGLREIDEFYAMSQNPALFISATGIADRLNFVFGYPRGEISKDVIAAFVEGFDAVLDEWATLAKPSVPPPWVVLDEPVPGEAPTDERPRDVAPAR